MPTLKVDGKEVAVEKGRTIIQACEQLGLEVPRYCYHPGLRVVGSCRMCLVEVEKMPKLQIACNTMVSDGMVVATQSAKVKEARRSVLEFLLLNHPLDCPVCDRAGECELQNFYMKFGQHDSRMLENKAKKRKAFPIGPHVILDQERCVLCSRCIRFTDEISKTNELGIFNKGTWSEVNVYPGRELDNKYSGNVVDICPVGALLDRDFRYKMSVWYLKESFSVCPGCSMGCNIRVNYNTDRTYKTKGKRVLRLKPRFNEAVNRYWMCDEGRYDYKWLDENRLEQPLKRTPEGLQPGNWSDAISFVAQQIRKAIDESGPGSVGIVSSAQMTNEELFLGRKIFFEHLGIPLMHFHIPPKPDASQDDFLIKKDKNPNTKGAETILSEQKGLPVEALLDLAKEGRLKVLFVIHSDLVEEFGLERVTEALKNVPTVIYMGTNRNEMSLFSAWVLAAAAYAEKDGTFTNFQGRVQRIFPAFPPIGEAKTTLEILRDIGRGLGADVPSAQAPEVFNRMAQEIAGFAGMNYGNVGLSGRLLAAQTEPATAGAR